MDANSPAPDAYLDRVLVILVTLRQSPPPPVTLPAYYPPPSRIPAPRIVILLFTDTQGTVPRDLRLNLYEALLHMSRNPTPREN